MDEQYTNPPAEQPASAAYPAASPYPYPPYTPAPSREYTHRDRRMALLCWGLGYLFWRWAASAAGGGAAALWALLFLGVQIWFARGEKGRRVRWIPFGLTALFSLPFLLFDRGVLLDLDLVFLLIAGVMGICFAYDPPRWNWSDPLRGLLLRPFSCLGDGAAALFSKRKDTEKRRFSGIWWGLLLAVPVTALVGALLASADEAFSNLLGAIADSLEEWGLHPGPVILRLIGGIPVGLYLFGAACAGGRKEETLTDEGWEQARLAPRKIPSAVLLGAGIPVCLLYALFILAQSAYFFSAFSGLLPEGFTFAEYARRGFFELCAVAVINLLLLMGAGLFCRREGERLPLSLRIWGAALCGFTLLLIATALRKMILYIGEYGLTPLRVYTSWFMVLLGICFLILAVCRFFPRVKAAKPLTAAFVLMFALLQFSGVNGLIADYNVSRYLAGELKTVDAALFYRLGDGAVPAALKLVRDPDRDTALAAMEFIADRQEGWQSQNWMSFNLTTLRAKRAVAAADLPEPRTLTVDLSRVEEPVYSLTAVFRTEEGAEKESTGLCSADGSPLEGPAKIGISYKMIPPDTDPGRWTVKLYLTVMPEGEMLPVRGSIPLSDWTEGPKSVGIRGDQTGGFALIP